MTAIPGRIVPGRCLPSYHAACSPSSESEGKKDEILLRIYEGKDIVLGICDAGCKNVREGCPKASDRAGYAAGIVTEDAKAAARLDTARRMEKAENRMNGRKYPETCGKCMRVGN